MSFLNVAVVVLSVAVVVLNVAVTLLMLFVPFFAFNISINL